MAKWLFSSKGDPIAFVSDDKVFTRRGGFVGRLEGKEVWHGNLQDGPAAVQDRKGIDAAGRAWNSWHAGNPRHPAEPRRHHPAGGISRRPGLTDCKTHREIATGRYTRSHG
ncbi:hypothetical protein P3T21_007788 [Paraburkholderia sp. GAS334]